jgi:hypothetical protein
MKPATVFGIVAQLVRCVRGRSGRGGHAVVTGAIVRSTGLRPAAAVVASALQPGVAIF